MPHKYFELHAIKIYTHKILAKLYIYNLNKQTHFLNSCIHTEITVNIHIQHINEIPITINTIINHTGNKP
jgi:hypothetical protein